MSRARTQLLAAAISLALQPSWALAQDDETELEEELSELGEDDFPDLIGVDEEGGIMDEFALLQLQEEDIVYSAARHEQDIAESPSAITVITREQIENTHCTEIYCLLRAVPEVDVRELMPSFAVAGARSLTDGFYGDKALVILDGRDANNELFGMPLWQGLPVHMEDIERIEVIRGPGSALYGPNAHSMVVSITTRKASGNGAEVFLGSSEHDRTSLSARISLRLGDLDLLLSASRETGDNWRLPGKREYDTSRLRLRADYQGRSSTSTLDLYLWFPTGETMTSIATSNVPYSRQAYVFLTHQQEFLRAQVTLWLNDTAWHMDLPLEYGGSKLGEFPELLTFFTTNLDNEVQFNWSPFAGTLLIGGANYRWFTIVSETNDPRESYEHRLGAYLHAEQRLLERLVLTGSARLDYNSVTPLAFSPRLAAVWRYTDHQLLRLAFGQAFRKPSFYNTSTHVVGVKPEPGFEALADFFKKGIGNPDLANENITALEAGYRGLFLDNRLIAEAGLFYNRYRDTSGFHFEIATNFGVPDLKASKMRFTDKGQEVDSLGGSIALTYRVRDTLRLTANYTYRYSWFIADPDDPTEFASKGDRVLWEPQHLFNLSFNYLAKSGLRFGLSAHAHSESELALSEKGGLFDEQVLFPCASTLFFNGFLSWRVPMGERFVEAGVRAINILHNGYHDTAAAIRPDGTLFGGQLLGRRVFLFLRGAI